MTPKINVKDRFTDGEIDLSMSDLEEVPIKEIILLKKTYSLDLSNNRLTLLPTKFETLTSLTKLDLSKNELRQLPEEFGNLCKLKHLDLYRNRLQHLPLSFSKLKDLKWLDLKDNPLVPAVSKIAGPCLDTKQCQSCARDVVNFFARLEQQVSSELEIRSKTRKKQLEINQQKKQENKVKKQEKQKQKDAVIIQKNDMNQVIPKKSDNGKNIPQLSKTKLKNSFLHKIIVVLLLTSVLLFLLTSVKLYSTENVELFTKTVFARGIEKLPPNIKTYGVQFGNIFHTMHEKTGNVTLGLVQYLNNISKSKFDELFRNLANIFDSFVIKIRKTYHYIVPSL